MGCGASAPVADESLWKAEVIKASFEAALKAQITWAAGVIACPGAISSGDGEHSFRAPNGLPWEISARIDNVPGGMALVDFVDQKINEIVDKAASDPRVAEAMNKCLTEMAKEDATMRGCFHGTEFLGPSGAPVCDSICSYYEDEINDKLVEAIKPAVADAVQAVDGSSAYTAIKSAWDAVPSIPFVFEKPEVEFKSVVDGCADGLSAAIYHFMRAYELRQRAGVVNKMDNDCKKVFVDVMPPATVPYARQYSGYDMMPENPKFT